MRKIFLLLISIGCIYSLTAQKTAKSSTTDSPISNVDSQLFSKMKYRLIGPFRGGRSGAVTGSYKNKNTFYFGATGGGVWKTTDGETTGTIFLINILEARSVR